MNRTLLIVLVCVSGALLMGCLACGGFVYTIYSTTQPAADAANRLLSLLAEGKTREAYDATASGLRSIQTEEEFTRAVKKMGLTEFSSATWTSRHITNNNATVEGTVTTKSGGNLPLKVKLVQENGEWKVLSLIGPDAGAHTE